MGKLYYNAAAVATFFPYFELAASLFILLLAFQVWTRHYENKLARFYARFALVAFLAAILTYSLRIAFTLDIAREINRWSATLWAFVFAMYAHFALLFTRKEKFLEKPWSYFILYSPPCLIGLLFLFTNQMYLRHEIHSIGIVSQPAPLYALFMLETLIFNLLGIILFFQYSRTAPQKTERAQSFLVAVGSLIPVAVGISTDQLLPLFLGFRPTVPTVVFDIALMNLFIFIAMRRYSLFAISPALAADVIIETMPDSLLATDLEGNILFINEEAERLFCVEKTVCLGKNISTLFKNKEKYDQLYDEVVLKKKEIVRFDAELIDPLGEKLPALINANLIRDKMVGETIGIIFVVRDIRG